MTAWAKLRIMIRLSLPTRILLVILTIQALLFAALAAASLRNLRDDIATETRLASGTARSLVLATIGTMQSAVPPDQLMTTLPERLIPPRHTNIGILDPRGGTVRSVTDPAEGYTRAPAWFTTMVTPNPQEIRLPVMLEGRLRGFVYIATNPTAMIAAAWREMRLMLGLTALAALAQTVLILIAVRHALRPAGAIFTTLADLRRGVLSARVGPLPQPDLAPLAQGLDELATALEQAQADRIRLQRQVVSRGDQERKAIARDLHDEMGPCLFGLRVEADALHEAAPSPAIKDHAMAITSIAEEIARVNRALLNDLRPAAIGQLPLTTVLADYIADLGRRFPNIHITLDMAPDLPEPEEAIALTLFRILQEGTTNALRHSGAEVIAIRLWTDPAHWRMILTDDGTGFAAGSREGTGLTGMRERITLLGGSLDLSSDETGTTIEASLPRIQAG